MGTLLLAVSLALLIPSLAGITARKELPWSLLGLLLSSWLRELAGALVLPGESLAAWTWAPASAAIGAPSVLAAILSKARNDASAIRFTSRVATPPVFALGWLWFLAFFRNNPLPGPLQILLEPVFLYFGFLAGGICLAAALAVRVRARGQAWSWVASLALGVAAAGIFAASVREIWLSSRAPFFSRLLVANQRSREAQSLASARNRELVDLGNRVRWDSDGGRRLEPADREAAISWIRANLENDPSPVSKTGSEPVVRRSRPDSYSWLIWRATDDPRASQAPGFLRAVHDRRPPFNVIPLFHIVMALLETCPHGQTNGCPRPSKERFDSALTVAMWMLDQRNLTATHIASAIIEKAGADHSLAQCAAG